MGIRHAEDDSDEGEDDTCGKEKDSDPIEHCKLPQSALTLDVGCGQG